MPQFDKTKRKEQYNMFVSVLSEIEESEKEEVVPAQPSDIEIVADYIIKKYFKENFPEKTRFRCGNSARISHRKTQRKIKEAFECDLIKMMASYITDKDELNEKEKEMAELALNVAYIRKPVIVGVRYKLKDYLD